MAHLGPCDRSAWMLCYRCYLSRPVLKKYQGRSGAVQRRSLCPVGNARERSSSTQLSFRLRASATSANGLGNAPAISAPEKRPVTKMSCDWRRQPLRCGRPISDARGRVLVRRPDKRPNRKSLFPYHVIGSRGRVPCSTELLVNLHKVNPEAWVFRPKTVPVLC